MYEQQDLLAVSHVAPMAQSVCGTYLGPWYPSDKPAVFCRKPAVWRWTHPIIKSQGRVDPFDKIVEDFYCQEHGDRMQFDFAGIGKWEQIADAPKHEEAGP